MYTDGEISLHFWSLYAVKYFSNFCY
jgi:hypothetical protein